MQTKKITYVVKVAMLVISVVFVMSSVGWAATYYVDATNGDDNNNGLSPSNAFDVIKHHDNSLTFSLALFWESPMSRADPRGFSNVKGDPSEVS